MRACLHFASSFGFGFGGLIGFGDLVLGCRVGLRGFMVPGVFGVWTSSVEAAAFHDL